MKLWGGLRPPQLQPQLLLHRRRQNLAGSARALAHQASRPRSSSSSRFLWRRPLPPQKPGPVTRSGRPRCRLALLLLHPLLPSGSPPVRVMSGTDRGERDPVDRSVLLTGRGMTRQRGVGQGLGLGLVQGPHLFPASAWIDTRGPAGSSPDLTCRDPPRTQLGLCPVLAPGVVGSCTRTWRPQRRMTCAAAMGSPGHGRMRSSTGRWGEAGCSVLGHRQADRSGSGGMCSRHVCVCGGGEGARWPQDQHAHLAQRALTEVPLTGLPLTGVHSSGRASSTEAIMWPPHVLLVPPHVLLVPPHVLLVPPHVLLGPPHVLLGPHHVLLGPHHILRCPITYCGAPSHTAGAHLGIPWWFISMAESCSLFRLPAHLTCMMYCPPGMHAVLPT